VAERRRPTPRRPWTWREPEAETEEYPGLFVDDARVSGSITTGRTRMPLWCLPWPLVQGGWAEVRKGWDDIEQPPFSWDADKMAGFLSDLLEHRGELARLLLVLADVERREREREDRSRAPVRAWWERRQDRARVAAQLRRCLVALGEAEG
jgi:hypothetical protein